MPELNPISFRSAYDIKKYLLLIAIPPSDGDVRPDDPFGDFWKQKTNTSTGFPLYPSTPYIYQLSLIHYTTVQQYTHSRHLLIFTFTHYSAMMSSQVVQNSRMRHSFSSIHCIAGPKCWNCNKNRHYIQINIFSLMNYGGTELRSLFLF